MKIEHVTINSIIAYTILLVSLGLSMSCIHIFIEDIPKMISLGVLISCILAHIFTLFRCFIQQRKMYRLYNNVYLLSTFVGIGLFFTFGVPLIVPIGLYTLSHVYRIRGNRLILPKYIFDITKDKSIIYNIAINDVVYDILFYVGEHTYEYEFYLDTEYMTSIEKDDMESFISECLEPYVDKISFKISEYNFDIKINYDNFESLNEKIEKLKTEINEQERRIKK